MIDCSNMTAAQLMARAEEHIETEHELSAILIRAADLAQETNPALAMLFRVISGEPSEVAASWSDDMIALSRDLHVDTDEPMLANAVSEALAQFADD